MEYQPLYTVKEVAAVLKTSTHRVYSLMNEGYLPFIKLGNRKVRGSDLKRYIEGDTWKLEKNGGCHG